MPSALGTITVIESVASPGPVKFDRITLVGDALTPALGTAGFLAAFRTAKGGQALNIMAVIPQACAGYQVAYDHANDKMMVFRGDNDNAGDAPGIAVTDNTDLSAITFNLVVISY